MREIAPSLNLPQSEFLALSKTHKFVALVAGFGSGKTYGGAAGLCSHALECPGVPMGYFAPTYPMIRDIFFPTIEEVADDWGMTADIKVSAKEVFLKEGKRTRAMIICRSMDNPASIIGFKIGHAQVDEIDTMPKEKAQHAWRKIIARLRYKSKLEHIEALVRNGVGVTTTPEGYGFVYDQFVKEPRLKPELRKLYAVVHASTYENEKFLPDGYIDSMRASYPAQLVNAYIRGQFVNMTSGAVYPEFSRTLNACTTTRIRGDKARGIKGELLHVGMDFNVLNMTANVFVTRNGEPHLIEEITKVRDTPDMARLLKERYRIESDHPVIIYPDASGGNTSSKNASESDITILGQAGFQMRFNPANPAVKDRINSVNAMILNAKGERRLKVNVEQCPEATEAMEQQIYDDNGEPDKKGGKDHSNDATGYRIVQDWPVVRPESIVRPLHA